MTTLGIGLDFGTSNSAVAVYDGDNVRVLPIDQKNVLAEVVKSILYITRDDQKYIGQEAVELYFSDNINRARRYVQKWAGELEYVGAEMRYVRDVYVLVDELKPGRLMQYLKTVLRKSGEIDSFEGTQVFERYYTIADLIEAYLILLKIRAEEILGSKIKRATFGRPVKFSNDPVLDQNAETTLRLAAEKAGFVSIDFELEPIAAALFYEKTLTRTQNVLIFDFGGGTLDIAIMQLGDKQHRKVFSSGGIDIAGSDFDRVIIEKRLLPFFGSEEIDHFPEILELIHSVPDWIALPELSTPRNRNILEKAIQEKISPVSLKRLHSLIFKDLAFYFYNNVEAAKISLSNHGAAIINLDDQDIDLWEIYTRWQFEKDIAEFQEQIEKTLVETIEKSGLRTEQIDAVVKTGGSSSIPLFTEMLERKFGQTKVKQSSQFSSVVSGLAIRDYETSKQSND
jgi:hypothetical chaperone protein